MGASCGLCDPVWTWLCPNVGKPRTQKLIFLARPIAKAHKSGIDWRKKGAVDGTDQAGYGRRRARRVHRGGAPDCGKAGQQVWSGCGGLVVGPCARATAVDLGIDAERRHAYYRDMAQTEAARPDGPRADGLRS